MEQFTEPLLNATHEISDYLPLDASQSGDRFHTSALDS